MSRLLLALGALVAAVGCAGTTVAPQSFSDLCLAWQTAPSGFLFPDVPEECKRISPAPPAAEPGPGGAILFAPDGL